MSQAPNSQGPPPPGLIHPTTDILVYIGFIGMVINLVVSYGVTMLLKTPKTREGADQTAPADYFTDVAGPAPAASPAPAAPAVPTGA